MDAAIQGVNTQEQIELLEFVKSNNNTLKDVPTIILGNKIDDPEDTEKLSLVEETRSKVIEIFGPSCSKSSLDRLLATTKEQGSSTEKRDCGAVFVPISAMNAFIYRTCKVSHLTVSTFNKFDKDVIDKIGREEKGREWKRLSNEQKAQVISDIIGDPEEYEKRLQETNFESFMNALAYYIGSQNDTQEKLLQDQIDVALKKLGTKETGSIAQSIHGIFKRSTAISRSTKDLPTHFWRVYKEVEDDAFNALNNADPKVLVRPFKELENYYNLTGVLNWDGERDSTNQAMKTLLLRQLNLVVDSKKGWNFEAFFENVGVIKSKPWFCAGDKCSRYPQCCGEQICINGIYLQQTNGYYVHCGNTCSVREWQMPKEVTWKNLSPHDWVQILSSILLPALEMEVYSHFGAEKTTLEEIVMELRIRYSFGITMETSSLSSNEATYLNDIANPSNDFKQAAMKIKMPADLDDASHWGHLLFRYIKVRRNDAN
jgi:hypothetical protein